jgi:hypothetical protein
MKTFKIGTLGIKAVISHIESVKHKSLIIQQKENKCLGSFLNKSAASSSQPLGVNQTITNITNSGCATGAMTTMKETENTSQVQLAFGGNDTLKAEIIWTFKKCKTS